MTHILNILICLTTFATINVATNDAISNQLIQESTDSYCVDKILDLEKIVLDLASRLQAVENKNQAIENKNKDMKDELLAGKLQVGVLEEKLEQQDKLLMDVTSRINNIEFKIHDHECQDIRKENYELKSKIEDINDEFRKHVTSSEIQFGVIEQIFDDHVTASENRLDIIGKIVEDHVTTSDNRFDEVEENLRNHINTSESHFRQLEDSQRDHVTSSDEHFSQVDNSLGEITTTIT